jgi:phosphoenolpyruvate carboxykinase (diphosphate)
VAAIVARDYTGVYRDPEHAARAQRPILSPERSLGSVIKLLTVSPEYTDEYNEWLRQLPQTIRQLVFTVKRYYRPEWGEDWREHFTVDRINGYLGHELKYENQKLVGNYLRVGFDPEGSWRIYKLRPDFHPADKLQVEDDITVSTVVPRDRVPYFDPKYSNRSAKLVANCEEYLFQRPDDAVHRGFDAAAEADIATPGTFLSNFEPLSREQVRALADRVIEFDEYTAPMQHLLGEFARGTGEGYAVSSAHARLVDGKPSKNPRYLQRRSDHVDPLCAHLAAICARLDRGIPADEPVQFPVHSVLAGRRGNPADPSIGLPPLAVYSPIHYQELPELFMDFVCSVTGKSPSTTGFGSEGALTKGPFNALWPVVDLNNALLAAILTESAGFTTAAGFVGPKFRVDHDISMLAPELWCRIQVPERDPKFLIENGLLERVEDFEYEGRTVRASRLGYRITAAFSDRFLGRIFEAPNSVFPEELLRPETQDLASFAAGVDAIVETQRKIALGYFEDGSIAGACPPLAALLHIMAYGTWEGQDVSSPAVRALFTRESVLESAWYTERLRTQQQREIALAKRKIAALEALPAGLQTGGFNVQARLAEARAQLKRVTASAYFSELVGTIGADPFTAQ